MSHYTDCILTVTVNNFKFFVQCIVIQLRNVTQQNARFSYQCFHSILGVFYMFRTSCAHHQEDHLCMLLFMVRFSFDYVSNRAHPSTRMTDYIDA